MKQIMKPLAAALSLVMLFTATSCGQQSAGGGNGGAAPEISGVADQSVQAGTEFDAMAGVTASDAEDGDITAKISITSMPDLSFQNGKTTPADPGDYELTYTVTDAGGQETKAYATLTVTRQTGEAEEFLNMDFETAYTPDGHGWTANVADGVSATGELKDGAYVFDITDPGSGDTDIQLVKSGVALKAADYRVKVWAKSTKDTYAHILANASSGDNLGGAYNVKIGAAIAPLEMNFTSSGETTADLLINLGKITPNPDNASDTTPSDFTVTIDKIEFYEITGEQTLTPVYTASFSDASEAAVNAGDGADASVAVSGGSAVYTINSYAGTDGGVWSIKADLALPGVTVDAGGKYYYRFTAKADGAQTGECLVESSAEADKARANFNSLNLAAGEETVITNTFTAESAVTDPVIRLQIGSAADGVTSNSITITGLEFGKVEGDLNTAKTIDCFGESNTTTPNTDVLWTTYNGTDEDNDQGVGTIWTSDGSLHYRIDQGGSVDWHNKLIFGYSDKPLTLPADSYFTVEITAKASQPISCGFFLNVLGGWDPRISEAIDFTTEEQTFTFTTTDTLIMDMDFEMLFQFGSADTAALGETTIDISNITIYQSSVV